MKFKCEFFEFNALIFENSRRILNLILFLGFVKILGRISYIINAFLNL